MRVTEDRWLVMAEQANYDHLHLARLCGVSLRQLERVCLARFDQTPTEWLNEKRLARAQELLAQGLPIKAVAIELGYGHASNFCREFKDVIGLKPSQWASLMTAYRECRPAITNVAGG